MKCSNQTPIAQNSMKTYFIIIGPPQNGKTTLSKIIAEKLDMKFGSTSSIVYKELAKDLNISVEELLSKPKEEIRPSLTLKGNELCSTVKTYLIDRLLDQDVTIIDGARRVSELKESQAKLSSLGKVYTIWVQNPRTPKIQDNTEVSPSMSDIQILNDSSIEELSKRIHDILVELSLNPKVI